MSQRSGYCMGPSLIPGNAGPRGDVVAAVAFVAAGAAAGALLINVTN